MNNRSVWLGVAVALCLFASASAQFCDIDTYTRCLSIYQNIDPMDFTNVNAVCNFYLDFIGCFFNNNCFGGTGEVVIASAAATLSSIGCSVPDWVSDVCARRSYGFTSDTCGAFGDPHIQTFYDAMTCKSLGRHPLLLNQWLEVYWTNEEIDATTGATGTTTIEVITKNCTDETFTFSNDAPFPSSTSVLSDKAHAALLTSFGDQADLYLPGLSTHVQVRRIGGYLVFGIRTPLAAESSGACVSGCPFEDRIDVTSFAKRELRMARQEAEAACEDIEDSFFRQACVFDVAVTGNTSFVEAASTGAAVYTSLQSETEEEFFTAAAEAGGGGDGGAADTLAPFRFMF
ncbi:RGMC protein [Balamuthia mandrillaris]